MGNPVVGLVFAYLGDSLKIFALPVTTIGRASERAIGLGAGLIVLLALTVIAGGLRLIISHVPGGLSQPLSMLDVSLESASYFLFFILSYLVLFALVIVFGGATDLSKLLAAKLSLASAIVGSFALALFAKLIVGLMFLGATDGVGGGLIVLGEQFAVVALGLILAVYTLIVARFGGQLSWVFAVIVGVIHFALMVALFAAYSVLTV